MPFENVIIATVHDTVSDKMLTSLEGVNAHRETLLDVVNYHRDITRLGLMLTERHH